MNRSYTYSISVCSVNLENLFKNFYQLPAILVYYCLLYKSRLLFWNSHCNQISSLIISLFPSGFQARRPRSAPHLTPDPEPLLQLRSDFTSRSQELEHVRLQQQKSACAALAGESLSNARQAELRDVRTGPSSLEGPCQSPNHRRNTRKCADRTSVPCYKRNAVKRGKKLSSVKMAYVRKTLSETWRTLERFVNFSYQIIFISTAYRTEI